MDSLENKEVALLREVLRLNKKIEQLEEELRVLKSKSYQITPDNYPKHNTHITWERSIGEEKGY